MRLTLDKKLEKNLRTMLICSMTDTIELTVLIDELAKKEHIPLHYDGKMEQLEWVSLMNNYKHCAEEIIYSEFIYV